MIGIQREKQIDLGLKEIEQLKSVLALLSGSLESLEQRIKALEQQKDDNGYRQRPPSRRN